MRHKKLCDEVADLDSKAFTPFHVRDDPLIYSGHAVNRTKTAPAGAGGRSNKPVAQPPEVTEQKGDLLIRDLWQQGIDSVHDMHVVNNNAPTLRTKDPVWCLHEVEREGEWMYL